MDSDVFYYPLPTAHYPLLLCDNEIRAPLFFIVDDDLAYVIRRVGAKDNADSESRALVAIRAADGCPFRADTD